VSSSPATNLAGREEVIGRKYPIILERLLLVGVVVVFILGYPEVSDRTGDGFVSLLSTWCLFPFVLLFSAEMIGRVIQAINRD
tara:strand:- start:901 stop:1149 length:249 start_codon:yes stop_codon:yes gene_type:complete